MLGTDPASVSAAITLDDSSDTRTVYADFLSFAAGRGLPLHTVERRAEVAPLIKHYAPDVCIVSGWYWLIPQVLIEAVPKGFIGIHFSLLPRYRGGSPLIWAMINGEAETGVSMFSLVNDVDAGDLWAQRRTEIEAGEYVGTVLSRLERETIAMVRDVYPRILDGSASAVPQDHSRATVFPPRTANDGLVDWRWPAEAVARFVRAQSRPYPGAFTHDASSRVTIWRARVGEQAMGQAGDVFRGTGTWDVVCGDQRTLIVEEAEQQGRLGSLRDLLSPTTTRLGASSV